MPHHFEFRPYHAALRQPLLTVHGAWSEREGLIIRLTDDHGRVALGEIAPLPGWGTETLEDATAFCAALPPRVDAPEVWNVPEPLPCCQFAFETALAALGHPNAPAPVRSFNIAALLPAGSAVLGSLDAAVARGYSCFKWKVGVGPTAEEIALLPRVLERLPSGGSLRLDANGGWDVATTRAWLEVCEGKPVEFIEQPFPPGQEGTVIQLAHEFTTRIALDESVARRADLIRWLEFGWPGIYVIKPSLAGSPSRLLQLLEGYEVEAVFSSALETAVGARAALLFAARASHDHRALGFGTIGCFADEHLNLPDPGPTLSTKWLNRLATDSLWEHLSSVPHAA
jgi:O-succinylbenzoate synthase